MKRLKLSTKITWKYALIFTAILLIINFAVYLSTLFYNRLNASNEVQLILSDISQKITAGENVTEESLRGSGVVFPLYVEVSSTGSKVTSLDNFSLSSVAGKYVLEKHYDKGDEVSKNLISTSEKVAGPSEVYTVTVVKDLSVFTFINSVTLVTLIIASLLGVFVSYIVGYFISKQSFSPILDMTKSAAAIGPGNIHDRIIGPPVQDELKELSETFNGLLDRLDDAYSKQAKFVSDASHELRTPLTVIKGYNDLLMRWGKDDPEILNEAIGAIRSETDNMSMLVENLLFIAKGENKKMQLIRKVFNIHELLEEISKDSSLSVADRKFPVLGDNFEVFQDRRMIKQLVRIFIENSVKFTREGSSISLEAKKMDGFYTLIVSDDGEGIPQEDIDKIFERFYVADKARTKDKAGSGLGLSIAKWIVETHHGEIKVESSLGKGTKMIVTFPLDEENIEGV
ncbi:MAG: ATP-binding protein [Clostridiaceae bacterium]